MSPFSAIQLRGSGSTRVAWPAAAPTPTWCRRHPPSQGVCPFFGLTGPARPSFGSGGGKGRKGRVDESPSSHSQAGCSLSALWKRDGCRPSGHRRVQRLQGHVQLLTSHLPGGRTPRCFPLNALSCVVQTPGSPWCSPVCGAQLCGVTLGVCLPEASPIGPAPDGPSLQRALCQGRRGVCRAPKRGAWDPHPGPCPKGPYDVTLRRVHRA